MLKFVGYATLGFIGLVVAVGVLGLFVGTLGSLYAWLIRDGLPSLVILAVLSVIGYGVWNLMFGPD